MTIKMLLIYLSLNAILDTSINKHRIIMRNKNKCMIFTIKNQPVEKL